MKKITAIKSIYIVSLFIIIVAGCKKDDEDSIQDLLTMHKWKLTITEVSFAGNDIVDPINTTDNHQLSCEVDDCWIFDNNNGYEQNNGTVMCDGYEETLEDWGEWELDDSWLEDGENAYLYTYSDNIDYLIQEVEYEIIEITTHKMVLRFGGCVDITNPDEDGACITYTFEAK